MDLLKLTEEARRSNSKEDTNTSEKTITNTEEGEYFDPVLSEVRAAMKCIGEGGASTSNVTSTSPSSRYWRGTPESFVAANGKSFIVTTSPETVQAIREGEQPFFGATRKAPSS